eukprot:4044687-Lingulodinium_polyedra.AAC.1
MPRLWPRGESRAAGPPRAAPGQQQQRRSPTSPGAAKRLGSSARSAAHSLAMASRAQHGCGHDGIAE